MSSRQKIHRAIERRPRGRHSCDLSTCRSPLDQDAEYPVLHGSGHYFSGARVFCSDEHRDEYESRLILANTSRRGDPKVPGVVRRYGEIVAEGDDPQ